MKLIPIASACSAFPVDFALLNHEDRQFVAFYDEKREITVGSRPLVSERWTFFRPKGRWLPARNRFAHQTDFDSHNYLALAVDGDGHLHLSGNMHVDPLVYFRSTRPLDIESLVSVEQMTGLAEDRVTYPLFFNGPRGEFLFRYRDGQSGNGVDYYNIYNPAAQTWSRLLDRPLLDGEDRRNAYAQLPKLGPDGRWHLIWMWRDTHHCETNHTLSYAQSRDLIHWARMDGTPVALPITLATGDVVDPVLIKTGLINMSQELGFDHAHRPILTYHRYDAGGRSQAYATRWENGSWQVRQLSDWNFRWDFSGGGSIAREVTVSAVTAEASGRLEVAYESKRTGRGVWVIDEATLKIVGKKPAPEPLLPENLRRPSQGIHTTVEVKTLPAEGRAANGRIYLLRWETLPVNRDRIPSSDTPPTRLEVVEIG